MPYWTARPFVTWSSLASLRSRITSWSGRARAAGFLDRLGGLVLLEHAHAFDENISSVLFLFLGHENLLLELLCFDESRRCVTAR